MTLKTPWIKTFNSPEKPVLRLFCFPHAGGGTASFANWHHQLPNDVEVISVQLPGREHRLNESPHVSIQAIVLETREAMLTKLNLPYVIFGHGMGSLLAFELVSLFSHGNIALPLHLLVSGYRAPHFALKLPKLHLLPHDEFIESIRNLGGIPASVFNNTQLLELVLPILRADLQICESYRYRSSPPLNCAITAMGSFEDKNLTLPELNAWQQHTTGPFSAQQFKGEYYYGFEQNSPLLRFVYQILEAEKNKLRETVMS